MDISTKDIILLLVGALLGYLPSLWPLGVKSYYGFQRKRRMRLLHPNSVSGWLLEYHRRRGTVDDLYSVKIDGESIHLPFLTKADWLIARRQAVGEDWPLAFDGTTATFVTDQKLINKKKKLGQRIFNEPTLFIDQIVLGEAIFRVNAKQCSYFELVTAMSQLENETVKAISKNKFTELPIRDQHLSSAYIAAIPHHLPFSVGAVVLIAFKDGNDYKVIIQRRSSLTATYGGYLSVIPSYGLAPSHAALEDMSLTFYNFIKEFAEELYDYEQLIQQLSAKRGEYNWFLEIDEIKAVTDSFRQGSSEFIMTGFGIDLLNGTNTLSYLCIINDELLGKKIRHRIVGNWEAEGNENKRAIEFVSIRDKKILQDIRENNYHFGSAFCIARALEYLTTKKR